jgi:signal transduction histidine kinase
MPPSNDEASSPPDLRTRAEARLALQARPTPDLALADALKLVHELQVHQVELQLQQAELERLQAELKTALTRQLWLFDQAPVGYCSLDPDGVVREANAMAGALLRQAVDGLPGRRLDAYFTADGASAVGTLLRRVAAWPVPHAAEARLQGDPPALLEVLARADPDGQGFVVALLDASARRQAEDQRRRAELAERVNQARAVYISEMNHELRTPLGAVIGLSGLILGSGHTLTDQHRDWITQIERSGQHMLGLAGDALDLARIDAGRVDLQLTAVDVQASLLEAMSLVGATATARAMTMDLCAGPPCPVLADAQRLRQVVVNLLTNAIKYNRDGGHVQVTVAQQAGAGTVSVAVRDTGAGLDARQLQQLFQPFQRLGAERTPIEGTGLGLVLSRRLAEAMGGSLSLDSTPGVGTTATLVLQAAA